MKQSIHVLLVEDDEDDYILLKDVIAEMKHLSIELTWVDDYKKALQSIEDDLYDLFIVDFQLRGHTGLELLHELKKRNLRKPFIILTGHGHYDVDIQAMKEGVSDYLEKDSINAELLERAIRYAIERSKTMEALRQYKNKLRLLSEKLLDAQEIERKRIAKDLHDSIGSNLAAIKFGIEKQLHMEINPTEKEVTQKTLIQLVKDTISETQRIYSDLRPKVLDDLGILMAIKWFCRKFMDVYSDIQLESDMRIHEDDIPEKIKTVIYRVLQEALNNVVKHSSANRLKIALEKTDKNIRFLVQDNGHGFDADAILEKNTHFQEGMGLLSMKERVSFSGGKFNIRSQKNEGTAIQVSWPIFL